MSYKPHFASTLSFTPEDLIANRDNYMTKAQRVKLRRKRRRQTAGYTLGALVCSLFLILILAAAIDLRLALQADGMTFLSMLAGVLVFGGLGVVLAWEAVQRWQRFGADLRKGDASKIEGRATLVRVPGGEQDRYYLRIERLEFEVKFEQLRTFHDGERYRVYYAPNSRMLLSAEPVTPDEAQER